VVGTSSRKVRGKRRLDPGEVAREALSRPGCTALVFGDERSGLSNAEIDRCDELSAIPASAEQPSLNLAQAVLVYCYEARLASRDRAARPAPPRAVAATDAELRQVEELLRGALRGGGFLAGPERHAVRDLAATLRRARLTRAEVRLWTAALARLARPDRE